MFGWWRRRRRARVLAEPFPGEWRARLELEVALWRAVPEELKPRLEDDLRVFIAGRSWEPCGGLQLTPPMQAVIAAQACVLSLGHTVDAFGHVRSILVYPDRYRAPDVWEDEAGIVTEEVDERDGEAWHWGTVVLAWRELVADARSLNGRNLVLHEMAHQIDLLDTVESSRFGSPDERARHRRWRATFLDLYEAFCTEVDAGRRVKGLDAYGAEDEAEFFSVATESFFERGAFLRTHQPALYELLREYFNQDPADWPPPPSRPEAEAVSGRERRRLRRAAERRMAKRRPR
jgi:Mlc titration factor MtfA (ptsG expression regulator)